MTLKKKILVRLIFVSITALFVACNSAADKNAEKGSAEEIDFSLVPSMEVDSVYTLYSDSGRLTSRLQAPKLAIFDKVDEPYWDFPEGIHMTTYNKQGDVDGDISSKVAVFDVKKELWTLSVDVKAINPDGSMLETELLYWDRNKELIYSDKLVKITEDGMITLGSGFESDQRFEDWHMDNFSTEFIMED